VPHSELRPYCYGDRRLKSPKQKTQRAFRQPASLGEVGEADLSLRLMRLGSTPSAEKITITDHTPFNFSLEELKPGRGAP